MKRRLLFALLLGLLASPAFATVGEPEHGLRARWIDETHVEIEVIPAAAGATPALQLLRSPGGAQLEAVGANLYRLALLPGATLGDVDFVIEGEGLRTEASHRLQHRHHEAVEATVEVTEDPASNGLGRALRSIRIHGALSYVGVDGFVRYADGARIEVVDEDGIADAVLYNGVTGTDGSFDFTFPWDDGDLFDPQPDLRLRFYAENAYTKILYDDLFNYVYSWEYNLGDDFTGTDVAIFPRVTRNAGALHANSTLVRAGRYYENELGYVIPTVDVKWPSGASISHYDRPPITGIQITPGAIWSEDTLLHELGHHFNQVFSGFPSGGGYCNGICDNDGDCGHCGWCPENQPITWTEGYATFIGYLALVDQHANYVPKPYSNLGWERIGGCGETGMVGPQDMVEGFTTAFLRDLVDDTNEVDGAMDPVFGDESTMAVADVLGVTTSQDPMSPQEMVDALEAFVRSSGAYPIDEIQRFWATARNAGWEIDDDRPVNPTSIACTTHTPGVSSPVNVVGFSWSGMRDATSGIAGYAVELSAGIAVPPSTTTPNIGAVQQWLTPLPVAPGTYWFTLRAFDRAGRSASDFETVGPIVVGSPLPVNLTRYVPEFWTDAIVVTQTPGPVTPTTPDPLRTDVDTFFYFAFTNNSLGSAVVDPFTVYLKAMTSSWTPEFAPGVLVAGQQFTGSQNVGRVRPGRQTFTMRIDTRYEIGESVEYDNNWRRQWVFQPQLFTPAVDRDAVNFVAAGILETGSDTALGPIFAERTGFRVRSDGWWNAYVVYPDDWFDASPGDIDVYLYDVLSTGPESGFVAEVEASLLGPGESDAIFVNRNLVGLRDWDLGISHRSRFGGSTRGLLHHVRSELIALGAETALTIQAYPRMILREFSIDATQVGPFTARLTVPAGTPPLRVAILDDETTITSLSDLPVLATTDSTGLAVINTTIADPGYHCLVVWGPPDENAILSTTPDDAPLARALGDVAASVYVGPALPDMLPMADEQGWPLAVIPRPLPDGTSGWVGLPDSLIGDLPTTYLNLRLVNLSAAVVPFVATSVQLDGRTFTSNGFGPLTAYHVLPINDPNARTVPGGRHTLGVFTDFAGNLTESNEANNRTAWQWAWRPQTIAAETPLQRPAPAGAYEGTQWIPRTLSVGEDVGADGGPPLIFEPEIWPNSDGVRVEHADLGPDGRWWGAAILPRAGGDLTLNLHEASDDPQLGFTSTLATSAIGGSDEIEFVLVHHGLTPHRRFDLGIVNELDNTDGYDLLSTASSYLDSVPDGTYGTYLLDEKMLLALHDVRLTAGQWTVRLRGLDANADLGVSVHRPWAEDGSAHHARPDGRGLDPVSSSEPAGGVEEVQFEVAYGEEGSYCVAVWRPRQDYFLRAEAYELEFEHLSAPAPLVAIDGIAEAEYGPPIFVQSVQTGFGDNTLGRVDQADGSEIDAVYARIHAGVLYLLVAGNLESNFNRLDVFLDTVQGGQGRLVANNPTLSDDGLARMGDDGSGNGLTFDPGFEPDHYFTVGGGGEPYLLLVESAELPSNGGGHARLLGRTTAGPGGLLRGADADNPYGVRAAIDNSNVAGVTAGQAADSGAGVVTGVEWAIPLAAIGDPPGCFRMTVFVNGVFHDYVSNQVAGALPIGTPNLGEPRDVDFGAHAGEQSVEVCPSVVVGIGPSTPRPTHAVLHAARPNPFNPRTTLSFTLPRSETVELAVYDVAGRLITRLIDGRTLQAGRHAVTWDGRDANGSAVASGTYVLRLHAGSFADARRVTLLK